MTKPSTVPLAPLSPLPVGETVRPHRRHTSLAILGGLLFGTLLAPQSTANDAADSFPREGRGLGAEIRDGAETIVRPLVGGVVAGRVTRVAKEKIRRSGLLSAEPLSAVKVYAYQLANRSFTRVATDGEGRFFFRELPEGLYKIIAHKAGFLPAVIMLPRTSADDDQFLDLELVQQQSENTELNPWLVRQKIPGDILREMGLQAPEDTPTRLADARPEASRGREHRQIHLANSSQRALQAEMQAFAGIDETRSITPARVSGGRVDVSTRVGETELGLKGSFLQRQAAEGIESSTDFRTGEQSLIHLEMRRPEDDRRLDVLSHRNHTRNVGDGVDTPIDFENYQLAYSQRVGEKSRSGFRAHYTSETNFYSLGLLRPSEIPDESRTFSVEGNFSTILGSQSTFETQLRYRERQGNFLSPDSLEARHLEESLELIGRGDWRFQPAVVLEYGLYTQLRDGSLSLTPRGGLVWQLTSEWQAATEVSHRIHQEDTATYRDFVPAFHHEGASCDRAESSCYRISFTHEANEGEALTIGATHREFDETLRLYFDEEFSFLDQLNSLYLVRGDRLPEFQFAFSRRLAPRILATLESNIASGGGGLIYAVDNGTFENKVRYLVTSLDTQFQGTSTGVFIAFHHLQQELEAVGSRVREASATALELDRLQLLLTQDLNFLADLAADWAVHLNMEVSRGHSPAEGEGDDELRKRFLGGLAVRF